MTGIDPDRLRRRLRWAAGQLEVAADASADDVRAAWLRRLEEDDFVPPDEARWALAALLDRQPKGAAQEHADRAASLAEEDELRQEVDAFAGHFWDLPPPQRRGRWQELRQRCAFSAALRGRLQLLEAGLDVGSLPGEVGADGRLIELAAQVCDLFVLRPGPRAQARQALLGRLGQEQQEWAAAARRLRQTQPGLACLGVDLLDELEVVRKIPPRPPRSRVPESAASGDATMPRWLIWVAIFIACGGLRACMSAINRTPPPTFTPRDPPILEKPLPEWGEMDEVMKRLLKDKPEFEKLEEEWKRQQERKKAGQAPDKKDGKSS